jgi:hypothetical protein
LVVVIVVVVVVVAVAVAVAAVVLLLLFLLSLLLMLLLLSLLLRFCLVSARRCCLPRVALFLLVASSTPWPASTSSFPTSGMTTTLPR